VAVIGSTNSGKTQLIEQIVKILTDKMLSVDKVEDFKTMFESKPHLSYYSDMGINKY
jgi:molybdopterin-guanine dinucleotide biosynthesis protein